MKYLEFTFTTTPGGEAVQDVLSAVLAEIGFDSFVHTGSLDLPRQARTDDPEAPIFAEPSANDSYKAYIQQDLYDEEALKQALLDFPIPGVEIRYKLERRVGEALFPTARGGRSLCHRRNIPQKCAAGGIQHHHQSADVLWHRPSCHHVPDDSAHPRRRYGG